MKRHKLRKLLIDLACMGVIGVVLALIGPFGSFQDPLALRLIVWVGFAYIGYALYAPIDGVAQRLAPALDLPEWAVRFVGVMIASVPMAAAVTILPRLPGPIAWPGASAALTQYLYVAVVGGMITLLFTLGQRRSGAGQADAPLQSQPPLQSSEDVHPSPAPEQAPDTAVHDTAHTAAPRFVDRLPPELGTDLLALEMEDHYVRAHTALGSDLVLMRLGDAVAELGDLDGRQVHRSWWVARDAVEEIKREGRNVRLRLSSGVEAPVSRARVAELKQAGWL